ncbi:MAG TPA: hypothetical protein VJM34_04235 [Novosphingobium sp.]|nr:hypothetical protein [Novosphingobium sp.]
MAQLHLGQSILVTSPERDAFASLRAQYADLGRRYQTRLAPAYRTFDSIEELFAAFAELVEHVIAETANTAAADIAASRIYSVSKDILVRELWTRAETIGDEVGKIQTRYAEIVGKSAELDALRTADRESRSRLAGGGFGVEGAAQGIAIATVANAAMGIAYGLANLTAKGATAWGDRKKKKALLEDQHTTESLRNFLSALAVQGSEIVAEIVNRESADHIYDTVSSESRTKAQALVENANAGLVPDHDRSTVLLQSLELDPFNDEAWTKWIDWFGDADGSVTASANALGNGIVELHRKNLLSDKESSLIWSTPEECLENSDILEDYSMSLGLPFHDDRARIRLLAERLDHDRRTFNGITHNTIEEKERAQRDFESELSRTEAAKENYILSKNENKNRVFNGILYDTEAEAIEALNKYNKKFNFSALLLIAAFILSLFLYI